MSANDPKKVLSVILGGGRGSRLFPLTSKRSKPAVPVAGKYRLVDIPISNCLNSYMNKIFVLTQFNSASLNRHIKNSFNFDLFSKGFVDILAAEQTNENTNWYQGTADAVRQSFPHFEDIDYEYMLILSGDQLYQMNYQDLLDKHIESGAELSIGTIPVNASDATGFGIMKVDENNTITSFVEKPSFEELENWSSDTGKNMQELGKNYLASMGIYLFNRKTIKKLMMENEGTDFGKDIVPYALENCKVTSYQFEGYWTDIGTIKSFFEANLNLAEHIPAFNLYENDLPIYTHARMLPPAKIMGTTLENVIISDGAIIFASRLENSVVGIRTRIGQGATIETSYIMGSDFYETLEEIESLEKQGIPAIGVGERCFIKNAILDKNVRIGKDVRLIGRPELEDTETDTYQIVDGIIVIKKDAVIPNGFSI